MVLLDPAAHSHSYTFGINVTSWNVFNFCVKTKGIFFLQMDISNWRIYPVSNWSVTKVAYICVRQQILCLSWLFYFSIMIQQRQQILSCFLPLSKIPVKRNREVLIRWSSTNAVLLLKQHSTMKVRWFLSPSKAIIRVVSSWSRWWKQHTFRFWHIRAEVIFFEKKRAKKKFLK